METFSLLPVVRVHPPLYHTHVAFETVAYRRNCDATRTCDYLERMRLCYQVILALLLSFSLSLALVLFPVKATGMDYRGAVWDELQVQ